MYLIIKWLLVLGYNFIRDMVYSYMFKMKMENYFFFIIR